MANIVNTLGIDLSITIALSLFLMGIISFIIALALIVKYVFIEGDKND